MRLRLALFLTGLLWLSGCIAQLPWAPDERLVSSAYRASGQSSITLMTVVANGSKSAGHSSLLINGSQRVIYDPAGTWYNKEVPERADMLYGITPKMLQYYIDYHARERFHVVMQTKIVSREVADHLMRLAISKGASVNAMCAQNTSNLLSQTPGFEGFPVGFLPKNAIAGMDRVVGVNRREIFQTDEGKDLKE